MRLLPCSVTALALAAVAYGAQAPTLWQYIHPQARVIVGGDLKKAKTSMLWRVVQKEMGPGVSQMKTEGADVLDMVERFVVSSPVLPGEANQSVLIAFEGTLDRARIKKSLAPGTSIERFKGVDLYVPPKSRQTEMLFAVVNDRISMLGDRASISDALDAGAVKQGMLMARAQELSTRGEFWAVADGVGSLADPNSPSAKMWQDLQRTELVLALQKGIDLDVSLVTNSVESAHAMTAMIESAKYLMGAQAKEVMPAVDLMKSMLVTAVGNDVHLTWSMPAAQVQQTVAAMRDGVMQAATGMLAGMMSGPKPTLGWVDGTRPAVKGATLNATTPAVAVAPPRPQVPQKRTIKIVGLDSGDKEINYTTGTKRGQTN